MRTNCRCTFTLHFIVEQLPALPCGRGFAFNVVALLPMIRLALCRAIARAVHTARRAYKHRRLLALHTLLRYARVAARLCPLVVQGWRPRCCHGRKKVPRLSDICRPGAKKERIEVQQLAPTRANGKKTSVSSKSGPELYHAMKNGQKENEKKARTIDNEPFFCRGAIGGHWISWFLCHMVVVALHDAAWIPASIDCYAPFMNFTISLFALFACRMSKAWYCATSLPQEVGA